VVDMRKSIDKFKNIGDVISALRKEEGLTQEELGKKAGLSRITIVKIENSQRAVSLEEAMSIAKVFSIDVDTMYSYINNEEDSQDEENFAIAFKAKGMDSSNLREIKRIELLVEALFLQEEIRGE
jgi:DNA-binding XRE family transcriptional regulator